MTNQEIFTCIKDYFDSFPYNQMLGIQIEHICTERVDVVLPMQRTLIGNHLQNILHGGSIASVLDVAAAAVAMINMLQRRRPANLTDFDKKNS